MTDKGKIREEWIPRANQVKQYIIDNAKINYKED